MKSLTNNVNFNKSKNQLKLFFNKLEIELQLWSKLKGL